MSHLFISYAHEDRATATRLEEDLRFRGVSTWIHLRDISPGVRWSAELQEALSESRAVLVLLSPHGVRSEWVKHEYSFALAHRKPIIPALLADCELPEELQAVQHCDLRQYETGLARLLAAVPPELIAQEWTAEQLTSHLQSENPQIRSATLWRIAMHRLHEMIRPVIERMREDSSEEVRAAAAHALDQMCSPDAIPDLIKAIHDPAWIVRSNAGWALVHLGKPAAPAVQKVLVETNDPDAREMARLILSHL